MNKTPTYDPYPTTEEWISRMEEALSSEVVSVPLGLSKEEWLRFILEYAEGNE